jgi:NADH dehydrogenase FAD-containing subunit
MSVGTHPRLKTGVVCVVGGGIGGLALALALQQDGACVEVETILLVCIVHALTFLNKLVLIGVRKRRCI